MVMAAIEIKQTTHADEPAIRRVHEAAFGDKEGPVVAGLTIDLLHDPTAEPMISLLACVGDEAIGHVLFTAVRVSGETESPVATILAPLAVVPDHQGQGLGTQVVEHGLSMLRDAGCELAFVLGHPGYYPRFGFNPAGRQGFEATYPIGEKNADAWMVLELHPGTMARACGKIQCAEALDKPEYWQE